MIRYSNENVLDGAIFAFAHGTDPELLVIVEAQKSTSEKSNPQAAGKQEWKVALAPMTAYAINAKLDGKDYWSVAWRQAPHAVSATFRDIEFPPKR